MNPALLDVNVLLALAWPNHQHHGAAHRWFTGNSKFGWATCSMTELGFVRLSSNPAYTEEAVTPAEAAELLRAFTREPNHRFLKSPPAGNPRIYAHALGHGQVNDAWLVEVARKNNARFVTFDSRVQGHAGEERLVEVIHQFT